MQRQTIRLLASLMLLTLPLASPSMAQELSLETYTLPSGLTVILHEDHRLPQVVVNTWFAVGSKDELPGRTGFAHLFEHLMFMGTERVPGSQYDVIMETGGGWNNASTSTDRTNYFSTGPSDLLPTLLWLDADRLEALGAFMTQEKLDLQREVVRNERRQGVENTPYGLARIIVPEALYPEGHPYHHAVIGSHEDLEAATLQDVKDFFSTFYVPGNASLVVAGDFDAAAVKEVIARTFGAVPAQTLPAHRRAAPVTLAAEVRRLAVDEVEYPRLYLVWHSPAGYAEGDAEMDLLAEILAGGPSTRLEKRLVIETGLAQEVEAYQYSKELGSEFHVEATAAPGADLEVIKREILAVIGELQREGPTPAELRRVRATQEGRFLKRQESLLARADQLNAYRHHFGDADGFARDLARWTSATAEGVRHWARQVLGEGRLDLRILPAGARVEGANLDERPDAFPPGRFEPPSPVRFTLSNGIEIHALSRPGTRLFAGTLLVEGGEQLVPHEKAGLSSLLATMLTSGAGGRSTSEYAEAVDSLGARVRAASGPLAITVSVDGLTSHLEETFDLFADAVRRPNLEARDIQREVSLAVAGIEARGDNPGAVARLVARRLLFGDESPHGRPVEGYAGTVDTLPPDEVAGWSSRLVHPAQARFVFVGDFQPDALQQVLEERFGDWSATAAASLVGPVPLDEPPPGRLVLVDRPGAPQTFIYLLRPVAPPRDDGDRVLRDCLSTLFGGSFTSRLNQNLREKHGYTYGAGSAIRQEGSQHLLLAASAVQTAVTGAALGEFRREFASMAAGTVTRDELSKARETMRTELVDTAATTGSLAGTYAGFLADGRPLDAVRRDLAALDGVTLEAANAAARSGLYAWDALLVVLVGDREVVLPQLREAGFPEPALVDEEGRPLD